MKFEVGKYYQHSGGSMMHVVCGAVTTMYGGCLVAEIAGEPDLKPVGQDEAAAANWRETTYAEWMTNFSDDDSDDKMYGRG